MTNLYHRDSFKNQLKFKCGQSNQFFYLENAAYIFKEAENLQDRALKYGTKNLIQVECNKILYYIIVA